MSLNPNKDSAATIALFNVLLAGQVIAPDANKKAAIQDNSVAMKEAAMKTHADQARFAKHSTLFNNQPKPLKQPGCQRSSQQHKR